jgi:hypothetical protein
MERLNLKKLTEVELINRFAALENLDVEVDITSIRARGIIRDNIHNLAKMGVSLYKLKKHKRWLEGGPNCNSYRIQRGHVVA